VRSIVLRAGVSCILCGLLPVVATGQIPADKTAGSAPVTMIGDAEFDQMVQAGTLVPVTPELLAAENQSALASYLENTAYVEKYLREHRELITLAQLARIRPNPNDPKVKQNGNGTYSQTIVNSQGQTQTEISYGPETKMMALAGSIRTASDPIAQLRNYTAFYNRLPQSFTNGVGPQGVAVTRPIPPSQLQGASLETILGALDSLASQSATIAKIAPLPPGIINAIACGAEVGANPTLAEVYYGDETPVQPPATSPPLCSTPWSEGIIANFNFPNAGAVTCVKDQGIRGTCGVFAATSAVEELIAINTGVHVNLSEQDFWEKLTLQYTSPPQLYNDGYDAGYALSNALVNSYQFAYEKQWDYNPSWSDPGACTGGELCYDEACVNYPSSTLVEPACSDSSPQAREFCTIALHDIRCGFAAAVLSGRSPYSLGPGTFDGPGQVLAASSSSSVVGSVANIWNASGLVYPSMCNGCPPVYGGGPHPDLSVNLMKLALNLNFTVILGFEETDDFGPYDYVPCCDTNPGGDLTTDAGGHNIHVVGFVSNEDLVAKLPHIPRGAGGGYFILKNSWGPCAGDVGYYYMPIDYVKARAQAIYAVSYGK
jgi:C1A family cysteine protease